MSAPAPKLTVEVYEVFAESRILTSQFRWRILSGNNKVMAVSPDAYPNERNATRAALTLVGDVPHPIRLRVLEADKRLKQEKFLNPSVKAKAKPLQPVLSPMHIDVYRELHASPGF